MLHATLLVAAAATAARTDPTEILSIHGLAHSGTTIVGETLKEAHKACWVGRSLFHEAQWCHRTPSARASAPPAQRRPTYGHPAILTCRLLAIVQEPSPR